MNVIIRILALLIIIIIVSIVFLITYIKRRKENYIIVSILVIFFNVVTLLGLKDYIFDAINKETIKIIGVFKGYYGTGMNYLTTKQMSVYFPEKEETIELKIDILDNRYDNLIVGEYYLFEYYENTLIIDSISSK
jgi:uncharacterized membrane protein YfcA